MTKHGIPAPDRIRSRLIERPGPLSTPCWICTYGTNGVGYAQVVDGDGKGYAHRIMYEAIVGPIPGGLVLDHLCRVPRCCNPDHLEPVTHRTNILRGVGLAAENAAKTRCHRGHPLTRLTDSRRRCDTCRRESKRQGKRRRRAAGVPHDRA